jgi:malate dehydrogenase (oxaloacetate-decarboxylating)
VAAARALAELSPAHKDPGAALFPSVVQVRAVSHQVAVAVAREARREGLVENLSDAEIERRVDAKMWTPQYLPYRRVSHGEQVNPERVVDRVA